MDWHIGLVIQAALVLWLCARSDGRPRFAALMLANLIFEASQLTCERLGYKAAGANVWYLEVLLDIPLLTLALIEAADIRPRWHLYILCWWVSLTMGCAWIRFFPYTGRTLLIVNAAAYLAWIWLKALRTSK